MSENRFEKIRTSMQGQILERLKDLRIVEEGMAIVEPEREQINSIWRKESKAKDESEPGKAIINIPFPKFISTNGDLVEITLSLGDWTEIWAANPEYYSIEIVARDLALDIHKKEIGLLCKAVEEEAQEFEAADTKDLREILSRLTNGLKITHFS